MAASPDRSILEDVGALARQLAVASPHAPKPVSTPAVQHHPVPGGPASAPALALALVSIGPLTARQAA